MTSFSTHSSYMVTPMRSSVHCAHRVGAAGSVYGGAGGSGVRVSKAPSSNWTEHAEMSGKATMQNLNNRLGSYLEKVRSLEAANTKLELKIRQYLEKRVHLKQDFTSFNVRIKELQEQIITASCENAALILTIDNTKLATDDFRAKFESELALRQLEEADVTMIRRALDLEPQRRTRMELQLKSLKEELIQLKHNHKQDLLALRAQMGVDVNVEVDAAPQEDLSTVLAEMRKHYENVTIKNRKELEAWLQAKMMELDTVQEESTETLQASKSEVGQFRRTLQSLEIKLQAEISQKGAVEATLDETIRRYGVMLAVHQEQVTSLEEHLSQLRANLGQQGHDFKVLLDMKTRLEMEIREYRRLLEGEATSSVCTSPTTTTTTTTRLVVSVVEEVVDGRVMSSASSSSSSCSSSG
ncbi:keratin, type I cytoskeletal 13-like [Mugil cephalus]|uniref:keratin, type I cytoskeletal 13-like n=1 Tax=Mugil cephalus TaxID=48193 RepID=UPI001FB62CE4|nr:keratin, type I cytoskeletal 13-like [Mugil cephalus]XP_047427506.1 keratin, type I cytoskeletal 13-like [Mugil cephalus]